MSLQGLSDFENKLNNFVGKTPETVVKVLAVEWEKTVRKNFDAGGRPQKWEPRKRISKRQKGTNILVITGALKNYRAIIDHSSHTISLTPDPRARAYAKIHNEGGEINVPARQIRHRVKTYKSGRKRTVFASAKHKNAKSTMTKAYKIVIPKRHHTNIPPEDRDRIIKTIKQALNL